MFRGFEAERRRPLNRWAATQAMERKPLDRDLRAIRLCVELGFVRPETVARWADTVVASEQAPDPDFCELTLVAHKRESEILDLLGEYRDGASNAETWEKVLAWVAKRVRSGELDVGHVVRRIWALASAAGPSQDLYLAFSVLEDQYACARDGIYGSLPEVRQNLLDALDRFGRPGALGSVAA